MEWVLFLIGGLLIGILSGFFGIGGGIVLTPILLISGHSPSHAIMLSLMLTLGSTVSGTVAHIRLKNVEGRLAIALGFFGVIGSVSMVPIVKWLDQLNGADIVISILYIGVLSRFAYQFLHHETKESPKRGKGYTALIGLLTGWISSLMGVSGGFVMTPLLNKWLKVDLRKAIGTSITAASVIVLSGILSYFSSGTPMDWKHGLLLIAGALIGSPIGSKQLKKFKNHVVKQVLAYFYIAIAASVFLNLIHFTVLSICLIIGAGVIFFGWLFYKQVSCINEETYIYNSRKKSTTGNE